MTREIITLVLDAEGLKGGAQGFAVPEDREATCYVSAPGEIMGVGKLSKVELKDKYVALQTSKGERFFFVYEDVLGFKLATAAQAKERHAGFSR